jgi:hypothetical protein
LPCSQAFLFFCKKRGRFATRVEKCLSGENCVLAEELSVLDAGTSLWSAVRPLLDVALRLEQQDSRYSWHGWRKKQINAFLQGLPVHCVLLVGVWDSVPDVESGQEREKLVVGCVCEVAQGEICSIRTFEALTAAGLPPVEELEPGAEHAYELMQAAKSQVAPVAWALFTDKPTWDEWLFAGGDESDESDKGELLAHFARQGRCVLMGSQTRHHHP